MSYQSYPKATGAIPDGYVLKYSGTDGYWKPGAVRGGDGYIGIQYVKYTSDSGNFPDIGTSWASLGSLTARGTKFMVYAHMSGLTSGTGGTAYSRVRVDGNPVNHLSSYWELVNNSAGTGGTLMGVVEGLSEGEHTFELQVGKSGVSTWYINASTTPSMNGAWLMVIPQAVNGAGFGIAAGDLSGTYPDPTVAKIRGNLVAAQTLGAAHDGYILSWDNADGYWEAKPGASGSFTAGGDLSGSSSSQTVEKIKGTTITTAGGALPVGAVLRTTAVGTADWGTVDLADTDAVTGTLPTTRGGTGITSLGTGVATFLGTPTSANLASALTDETGTGEAVFSTTPTFKTSVKINNPANTFAYTLTPSAIAADRTLNIPLTTSTDTLVVESLAQTLTNKTLTSPIISSISNTGTLTLPTSTDTLVGRATTDTLTNKTLTSPVLTTPQINDTTADHQYVFAVSELAADRTVTLPLLTSADTFVFEAHAQTLTNKTLTAPVISTITNTGTLTLPTSTDTLVGRATTDTLTNKTLTSPILTTPQINDTSSDHRYIFAASELAANRTITLPLLTGNDTFVFESHTQTLANKTLTTPIISSISNSGTITIPTGTDTLVGRNTTDTLTNKTLTSPVLTTPQINDTSSDHQYIFVTSELVADRNITLPLLTGDDTFVFASHTQTLTNKTLTSPVISTITNTGTLTLPTSTDTLVGRATTDTLTNKTLTSPVLTTPQINDTSGDHQYIFAVNELVADRTVTLPLLGSADTFVFEAHTQTLTNKTLTSPTITSAVLTTPQINDTSSDHQYIFAVSELAADRTITLPLLTGDDTFVFASHAQTLTNKTLTSPTISTISNTGTLTLPTSTDTLVGRATTDTLTNKTLTSPILTTPQINDTSADHRYIFAVSELAANRTITLPLLTAADTFVFENHTQTLTNKTLTTPVISSISNSGTITIPTGTDTLVARNTTDTLTNKTLTTPVISSISNSGTITIPTGTDTLVGRATTDTLTNKTLTSPILTTPQINDTSADHRYIFAVSELIANRTITLPLLTGNDTFVFESHTQTLTNKTLTTPVISSISNSGTITVPTGTDTLVARNTTDTLTNKTLTSPVLTTPQINDTSATHQYVFVVSELVADRNVTLPLLTGDDTFVFAAHTQTLTNKTLTSPVISTITNTGTLTLPTSTDTLVGRATTDTLTNKTLTSPVISTIVNTGTLTLPTSTDTLVGRATTDTLTNKTLTSPILTTPQINDTSADHRYIFAVSELAANRTITLPLLTGADTFVFEAHTQTLTNKTLTSPTINTPSFGSSNLVTTGYISAGSSPASAGNIRLPSAGTVNANGALSLQTAGTSVITIDSSSQITLANTTTIEATATYGDFYTYLREVSTTDATVTDIFTWTIVDEAVSLVDVAITAVQSTGAAGASYKRSITFRRDGGTVSTIGSVRDNATDETASGWDVTIDNSTSTGRVRVTGAGATTIRWVATIRIQVATAS